MVKKSNGLITIEGSTTKASHFMCATCDNNITEFRAMKFPICDECLSNLREIIKEKKNEQ